MIRAEPKFKLRDKVKTNELYWSNLKRAAYTGRVTAIRPYALKEVSAWGYNYPGSIREIVQLVSVDNKEEINQNYFDIVRD